MFAKSSVTALGVILLVSALTGCASKTEEVSKKMSPSPINTPLYETALDYDAELVLANTELETQFLEIALASCKKAQTDGFIITDAVENKVSIFRPSETGMWPDWPFDQVSIIDDVPGLGRYDDIYKDYPPRLFDPCNLELQARRGGSKELLEHKVVTFGGEGFGWRQHQGGANFDEVIYEVKDGLISSYQSSGLKGQVVTYGPLSGEQNDLLDQPEN